MKTIYIAPVLTILAALGGMGCLFFAFFLYEPEQQAAQAALEKWWVAIDDAGIVLSGKIRNLANAATRLLLKLIDMVFGPRLLSFRALWAAGCLSIASVVISAGIDSEPLFSHRATLGIALAFAACAVLPPPSAPARMVAFGCANALLAALSVVVATVLVILLGRGQYGANLFVELLFGIPATVIGIFLNLFWAALLRWAAREFQGFVNVVRAVLLVTLILLVLKITVDVPPLVGANLMYWLSDHPQKAIWWLLPTLGLLRTGTIALMATWPIGAYLACVVLLIVFRAIWPLFPRLVYAAQRQHLVQDQQLLAKIGLTLLLASGASSMVGLARGLSPFLR